jgi:hypothetical protein
MTSSLDGKGLAERPVSDPKVIVILAPSRPAARDEKPYHTMGLDATDLYAAASFAGPMRALVSRVNV